MWIMDFTGLGMVILQTHIILKRLKCLEHFELSTVLSLIVAPGAKPIFEGKP